MKENIQLAPHEREDFEAAYAAEHRAAMGSNCTQRDIASMREADGYPTGLHYLNGHWKGWQARAALATQRAAEGIEAPTAVGALILGGAVSSTELGDNDVTLDRKVVERLQSELVKDSEDIAVELMLVAQHYRILQALRTERDVALAAVAQLHSMLGVTDQVQAGERLGFLVGQSIMVPKLEARISALAQPSTECATCGGAGMVDDGELPHSEGGIPYENGPIKCVKDCPDCAQPSPAPELDVTRILLDIAPGFDGMGEEVYAKSVADIEAKLAADGAHIEDLTLKLHAAQARVAELEQSQGAEVFLTLTGEITQLKDKLAELEKQEPVAFIVDVQGYKRLICATREEAASNAEHFEKRGRKSTITPLYAAPVAPVAQAGQVPEEVRTLLSRAQCEIEHLAECLENVCEDEEDVDVREDVADGRVVAADIAHLLAAAPAQGGE